MTSSPRNAVSFKDADPIWKAIFAWSQKPHGDHECGAILDAVGALVTAVRFEALEEAAKIAEETSDNDIPASSSAGNVIAAAIRERAKE